MPKLYEITCDGSAYLQDNFITKGYSGIPRYYVVAKDVYEAMDKWIDYTQVIISEVKQITIGLANTVNGILIS